MTSMERVLAALQGTPADRRAFTMTLSLYGAKLTNCPLRDYYSNPECYLAGQIAVAEQCAPDIIFTPFALAIEARAFGSEITFLEKSPPNVRKPFIRDLSELKKLSIPNIHSDPGLVYFQESTRLLAQQFKGNTPICGVLDSPLDMPAIIMGVENWLEILLFDPKRAADVVALMEEYFVEMANLMLQNGANFIALPMVFSNPRIVFEKTIEQQVVPALAKIFSKVKGPIVFHHGGNPLSKYLKFYSALPNIAGFVLGNRDPFSEARAILGDQTLLLGNLDGPSLSRIRPEITLDRTRKMLEERKSDLHYIFATSSADVPWDTPMESIRYIHDVMGEYGTAAA